MTDHTSGHEPDLERGRVADARADAAVVPGAEAARGHAHEHAFVREPAVDAPGNTVTAANERATPAAKPPARIAGVPEPELDRILITRMHARGHHGVFEHERRDGQDFYVDAEAWVDAAAASSSDHIGDTLHYGEWMHALHAIVTGEPVDLIETLAERLASATFGFDDAVAVRITVHKPQAPVALDFEDVAVSILRHRPAEPGVYLESDAAHAVPAGGGSGALGVGPAAASAAVSGSGSTGAFAPALASGSAVAAPPASPGDVPRGSAVAGDDLHAREVAGAAHTASEGGSESPALAAAAAVAAEPASGSAVTPAHASGSAVAAPPASRQETWRGSAGSEDDLYASEATSAAHAASDAAIVLDAGGAPNVPLPRVEPAGDLFSPVAQREQDERSPSDAAVVSRAGGAPNAAAAEPALRVRQAVIALGANLGDRDATLSAALRSITELPATKLVAASSLYETPALTLEGVSEEAPAYRNAVVLVDTELPADVLMQALHAIEDAHGRTRETRWGSRTLDLDLIQIAGELSSGELQLPHPRAHERAFVLAPWLEVDPRGRLEPHGSVAELRAAATDRVERVVQ